jgi:hypothetical protein
MFETRYFDHSGIMNTAVDYGDSVVVGQSNLGTPEIMNPEPNKKQDRMKGWMVECRSESLVNACWCKR